MRLYFNGKDFGKHIKQKRIIELDIDMRSASKILGISPATLSRCENGRLPDLMTYAKLCKWIGANMGSFILTKQSKELNKKP